jgi:hypothetical protein
LVEDASSEEGADYRPRLDSDVDEPAAAPRPAAVTFATTEHFTLQVARGSTIAESTGRATMFLGAVSGGLVALGLIATATRVGTAFYAFGLVLLPTLAFTGLVTFERVLQSGIEDLRYAERIALLRGYYIDEAPELIPYLLGVPEQRQADLPLHPRTQASNSTSYKCRGCGADAGRDCERSRAWSRSSRPYLPAPLSGCSLPSFLLTLWRLHSPQEARRPWPRWPH